MQPWNEDLVDALDTPIDSALIEFSKNPDLRIFMPLDISFGGDAIIAHSPITKITDLKGKKIGVEKNWISHFFLSYVLDTVGLSTKDVILVDMKASDIGSKMIAGKINAGSIQEPWLTKASEFTETNVLATSKEHPIVYAVLIVKKQTLEQKREAFEKLRKIWVSSLDILSKNKVDAIRIMAPYLGIPEVELAEQLEKIKFVDSNINLIPAMEKVQKILLKDNLIKEPLDLEKITDIN